RRAKWQHHDGPVARRHRPAQRHHDDHAAQWHRGDRHDDHDQDHAADANGPGGLLPPARDRSGHVRDDHPDIEHLTDHAQPVTPASIAIITGVCNRLDCRCFFFPRCAMMANADLPARRRPPDPVEPTTTDRWLSALMEGVLCAMVVGAPWLYGAVHAGFEWLLDAGVAVLLLLWAVRIVAARQLVLVRCPVTFLIALLLLLGLGQITPLPEPLLRFLSPQTAELYGQLLPATQERLADDSAGQDPSAATGTTISLDPSATRQQCYRLLAVLLLFAVVRNNLGSTRVLRRLAVVLV